MRIVVVCKYCNEHTKEEDATVEINFRDSCFYFVCPKCTKINKLYFKQLASPLPKSKIG